MSNDSYIVLKEVLHDNHVKHDIVLEGSKIASNHFSHDAVRLYKANASGEQIQRWYDDYKKLGSGYAPLQEQTGDTSINLDNWKDRLGKANWKGWVTFFDQEASKMSTQELLLKYLNKDVLGGSVTAYLLHGLISIGYGIEIESNEMVSEGLAQIASHFKGSDPLPKISDSRLSKLSTLDEFESILDALAKDPRSPEAANHLKLGGSTTSSLNVPLIQEFEEKLCLGKCQTKKEIDETCSMLVNYAILCHARGGANDFTLLHLLTSSVALRTLCSFCPSLAIDLIREWWITSLIAYLAKGAPRFQLKWNGDLDSTVMEHFKKSVFSHNDEHVVKGVLVCHQYFNSVPESLKSLLLRSAQVLLEIPSPPEKKGTTNWIYPLDPNPHASFSH